MNIPLKRKTKVTILVCLVLAIALQYLHGPIMAIAVGCVAGLLGSAIFKEPSYDVVICPNPECQAHVLRRKTCSECGTNLDGQTTIVCKTTKPEEY